MQIETEVRCQEIKLHVRVCGSGSTFPAYVVTRINPNASISRRVDCARA